MHLAVSVLRGYRAPRPPVQQSVRAAETVGDPTRGYDAGKKVNGRKRHIAVDSPPAGPQGPMADFPLLLRLRTASGVQGRLPHPAARAERVSTLTCDQEPYPAR